MYNVYKRCIQTGLWAVVDISPHQTPTEITRTQDLVEDKQAPSLPESTFKGYKISILSERII